MAGKSFTISARIKAVDKITRPVRRITSRLTRMTAPARRAWLAVRRLSDEVGFTRLLRGIRHVGRGLFSLARRAARATLVVGGLAAAITGIGVKRIVSDFAKWGDSTAKLARRLGVSAEALQFWRFAAERSGVSAKTFDSVMDALSKRMGELKAGSGRLNSLLKKTNPELLKQLKAAKSNEEAFRLLTKSISKLEDPQKRAALVSAAFSRQGLKMLNMFQLGEKGLKALREEFERLGGPVSRKALRNAEAYEDSQTNLNQAWRSLTGLLAERFLPILTRFINRMSDWIGKNKELIATKLDKFIKDVGKFLSEVDFGEFLRGVERTIDKVNSVVDSIGGWKVAGIGLAAILAGPLLAGVVGLGVGIGKLGLLLATNPFALVALGLGAVAFGVYEVVTNWDKHWGRIMRESSAFADDFEKDWKGALGGVAQRIVKATAKDGIFGLFGQASQEATTVGIGSLKLFGRRWDALVGKIEKSGFGKAARKAFDDITDSVKSWFEGFKKWLSGAVDWIKRQLSGIGDVLRGVRKFGDDLSRGLRDRLGIGDDDDKDAGTKHGKLPPSTQRSSLVRPSAKPAGATQADHARADVDVKVRPSPEFQASIDRRIEQGRRINLGVSTGKQFPNRVV